MKSTHEVSNLAYWHAYAATYTYLKSLRSPNCISWWIGSSWRALLALIMLNGVYWHVWVLGIAIAGLDAWVWLSLRTVPWNNELGMLIEGYCNHRCALCYIGRAPFAIVYCFLDCFTDNTYLQTNVVVQTRLLMHFLSLTVAWLKFNRDHVSGMLRDTTAAITKTARHAETLACRITCSVACSVLRLACVFFAVEACKQVLQRWRVACMRYA